MMPVLHAFCPDAECDTSIRALVPQQFTAPLRHDGIQCHQVHALCGGSRLSGRELLRLFLMQVPPQARG